MGPAGQHTNRYLALSTDVTPNQCLNICRSKHVYEDMLLKNGRTTAWHNGAKVIYHPDHVFNSRAHSSSLHMTRMTLRLVSYTTVTRVAVSRMNCARLTEG